MNTRVVGPSRVFAAASAALVATVSAWAFVSSTASVERDPFHFASIMAANARVQVAQLQTRTVSTCPNNPETEDYRAPACMRG